MRSWVRDLRRLAGGLGMTPALISELHRTARIRADFFDGALDAPLECFSRVLAALEETEPPRHASQGHLLVAQLIKQLETAVRDSRPLEPLLTELAYAAPARLALELVDSVRNHPAAPAAEGHHGQNRFEDRHARQHSSADRDAQDNQHEQAEADRKRDSENS